ncbi:MAG: type II toxin-antitoxin system VapC family toxin [Micropruina sp.]|uniref:type II toxin-antitoxin system VapC family toxin n=1 Tax=Micropruina sp. TaxID=2737536 RepID=UPI0039E34CFB
MILLLDTHLLLRAGYAPEKLSASLQTEIADDRNSLLFSAASIWEVAIKATLGRSDFTADARVLRRALIENGYTELPITGTHAAAVADLPPLHRDPFDRLLVAQARVEGVQLLTVDQQVAGYGQPVRLC